MKGYKTILLNGIVMLVPLVDMLVNNGALFSALLGEHTPVALSVLGLLNIGLRWITTTPIGKSE